MNSEGIARDFKRELNTYDSSIASIQESTSFLQGIKDGKIMATGQVLRRGNRIAFTEGWITSSANCTMISRSAGSYAIIKPG